MFDEYNTCPDCGRKAIKYGGIKRGGKRLQRYRCKSGHTFYKSKDYAPVTKRRSRWYL